MAEMTAAPPDTVGAVKSLKFSSLKAGDTVTVVTENSTYWFTLIAEKVYRRGSRWITGVSIVTNSRKFRPDHSKPPGDFGDQLHQNRKAGSLPKWRRYYQHQGNPRQRRGDLASLHQNPWAANALPRGNLFLILKTFRNICHYFILSSYSCKAII